MTKTMRVMIDLQLFMWLVSRSAWSLRICSAVWLDILATSRWWLMKKLKKKSTGTHARKPENMISHTRVGLGRSRSRSSSGSSISSRRSPRLPLSPVKSSSGEARQLSRSLYVQWSRKARRVI